jgi:hypothetical protein
VIGPGTLATPLVRAWCAPRAARFRRALDAPQRAQRLALSRILKDCALTEYGRAARLDARGDLDAFRARVPIVDYSALEPWIERQRATGGSVITPGRTRCYEPTSGSSGAVKHIPYNDALLRSFRSLFAIWADDLLERALRPRSGRMFMSISPQLGGCGGFADDREYLGPALRLLVGRFLVMPRGIGVATAPERFRDLVSCALVAAADLEIVSVWNPGYLLILLDHFQAHRARLVQALPPARRLALAGDPLAWSAVWPDLQLISCWTSAAAAAPARRLAALFPHAKLQGKGLLATEAPVTVPLSAAGGCLPLVDEVFLELEDADGRLRLLEEAGTGRDYSVIVTQAGGLLRYRLGDRVHVPAWHGSVPLLDFAGRADAVSDLVGEKLSEAFVARVLQEAVPGNAFCVLLPVAPDEGQPYYEVLTDCEVAGLAEALDKTLSSAFRYREARLLGQLAAPHVASAADMRRRVHDALVESGMRAGDVKDRPLIPAISAARHLHARIVASQGISA